MLPIQNGLCCFKRGGLAFPECRKKLAGHGASFRARLHCNGMKKGDYGVDTNNKKPRNMLMLRGFL